MNDRANQVGTACKTQANREQPLAGVQVLLVEDEFDVANLLLFILNEAGAETVWVMQSNDALACLHHFHPDILLSNIRLPDCDGDWLIQQLRHAESERGTHIPAIAITSYTRDVAANKMLEAGFDRFLSKPFDPEEIISIILALV